MGATHLVGIDADCCRWLFLLGFHGLRGPTLAFQELPLFRLLDLFAQKEKKNYVITPGNIQCLNGALYQEHPES